MVEYLPTHPFSSRARRDAEMAQAPVEVVKHLHTPVISHNLRGRSTSAAGGESAAAGSGGAAFAAIAPATFGQGRSCFVLGCAVVSPHYPHPHLLLLCSASGWYPKSSSMSSILVVTNTKLPRRLGRRGLETRDPPAQRKYLPLRPEIGEMLKSQKWGLRGI